MCAAAAPAPASVDADADADSALLRALVLRVRLKTLRSLALPEAAPPPPPQPLFPPAPAAPESPASLSLATSTDSSFAERSFGGAEAEAQLLERLRREHVQRLVRCGVGEAGAAHLLADARPAAPSSAATSATAAAPSAGPPLLPPQSFARGALADSRRLLLAFEGAAIAPLVGPSAAVWAER